MKLEFPNKNKLLVIKEFWNSEQESASSSLTHLQTQSVNFKLFEFSYSWSQLTGAAPVVEPAYDASNVARVI